MSNELNEALGQSRFVPKKLADQVTSLLNQPGIPHCKSVSHLLAYFLLRQLPAAMPSRIRLTIMSYITVIERYHEYRETLQELLASILTGIADQRILDDEKFQYITIKEIRERYPFIAMLYILDADGIQRSGNLEGEKREPNTNRAQGKDRSQRPYYKLAKHSDGVIVTQPYLSNESRHLCLSAAMRVHRTEGPAGYVVIDCNLAQVISFLMGDTARRRFEPFFKFIYVLIVLGIFSVTAILLYAAFKEMASLFQHEASSANSHLTPFSVIIFLTLALAIFDLGKTTLEEEVLMHKDIFRHSSTRRTITRFIAAILIAVSIEALLMMFKSAIDNSEALVPAVLMMLAAVGLLAGLGVYVYLGAKAEAILLARAPLPANHLDQDDPEY